MKDKILNITKIVLASAIFIIAILNYKTLSNLDVRILIAGASTIFVAELIIIGIYFVKAVLLILPASLIYISVGMAFDWKRAVIINIIGISLEVTITYFLGKFLGKSAVEKKLNGTKFGDKLLNMQNKKRNAAILTIRFLPVFPIDFSSLFMGAFDFSFAEYFIFSVLGLAPRVIAFTILGDGIYDLIPMKYIVLIVIIAIPIVIISTVVKKYFDKKKKTE